MKELTKPRRQPEGRIRRVGGGRRREPVRQPDLVKTLKKLVESTPRGDPASYLLWAGKSTRELADALGQAGYAISHPTVASLLHEMEYSLQANAKTLEGTDHPDRDQQVQHLNERVGRHLKAREPVISVDTKKKELIGPYQNKGLEWRSKGEPEKVLVHDFIDPAVPKAIPYGVYDGGKNQGWVNVGCDHDTATFVIESIRRWWRSMGAAALSKGHTGVNLRGRWGSNGYRLRLWNVELQRWAEETGLVVTVCHLPPGTSKWNEIAHRLFSHISMNLERAAVGES